MKSSIKPHWTITTLVVSLLLVVSMMPPTMAAPAVHTITKAGNPPLYNALHTKYKLDAARKGYITDVELASLTELDLSSISDLKSIEGVQYCTNTKVLGLGNDNALNHLPPDMSTMAKLEVIAFSGCKHLKNVENLHAITTAPILRSVQIENTDITDVSFLAAIPSLRTLLWSDNPGLTAENIATLTALTQVENVDLIGIPSIGADGGAALSTIAAMNNLEIVDISGSCVYDLSRLSGATHIQLLIARDNYLDLTPGSDDMKMINSMSLVWYEDQKQVTVKYATPLGTLSKRSEMVYYQQAVALPDVSDIPAAYELLGWDTDGDGTVDAAAGSTAPLPWPALPIPGDKTTFTACFNDLDPNRELTGIALSPASLKLSPAFSGMRFGYAVSLPASMGSVTLTAAKNDLAAMTIDGAAVAGKTVSVGCGQSKTVAIAVTSDQGNQTTYRVTVTRAKADASRLLSLGTTAGSLSPAFDPYKTGYTLTLPESTGSVTLKPVKSVSSSRLYINGKLTSSKTFALTPGQIVKATVRVVSATGAACTYTVTIKRNPSSNANLKSLTAAGAALSPAFSQSVLAYTLTVPENKGSVNIKVATADSKATATINGSKATSKTISIANGQSKTVTIVVTAQSGAKKTYTVTMTRPPHINSFSATPVVFRHPLV